MDACLCTMEGNIFPTTTMASLTEKEATQILTPILSPIPEPEIPESQDPLAGLPPQKRQALERRVSAPDTTPNLQVSTVMFLTELREKLCVLRFLPTASKWFSEVFWIPRDPGRVNKKYVDVTITCVLPWETNGKRTFIQDVVVAVSHDDFMHLAYMVDTFVKYTSTPPKKWDSFDIWIEDIKIGAEGRKDGRELIYQVIEATKASLATNWRAMECGGIAVAFQRRAVRKIVDMEGGMRSNSNIALSDSLARFFYAIVRTLIM